MPDFLGDQRDGIIDRATRQAEWALSNRAIGPTVTMDHAGAPSLPGTSDPGGFVTGYSAGVTVVPFMLDFSTLDGPDLLT